MNRLSHETSPYLLQHQHNPVDWYPWGPEAFAAAREQNKPIFLSVGYSTCYWCHVMERQSFEDIKVAAEMNKACICIKVDREERPDVDQLYMTAVQVLTRHGGWPMSVFLTPDLRPFYGGTYFPPRDMHGRPGVTTLMQSIADAWKNRRAEIEESADKLTSILQDATRPNLARSAFELDHEQIQRLLAQSIEDYEPTFGGYGSAPKFPRQTLLDLIVDYLDHHPDGELSDRLKHQLSHTLDMMARGGMRDQLGGGFHRYSTDEKWLVPHFEIMLYDNAMLAPIYAEASVLLQRPDFARIAREICDFVLREMTSPQGAFYTAMDAEVDAQEGLSYLWTDFEIQILLGPDAERFCEVYGVSQGPNFADPHHGAAQPDKNVLYLPQPIDEATYQQLSAARAKLKAERDTRKQPLLDTKIITSWNALMISALARVGKSLGIVQYNHAAARAANYLLSNHLSSDRSLARTSRDGQTRHAGCLDDYAFLANALLDLHEASSEDRWKQHAGQLIEQITRRFAADDGGLYFTAKNVDDLIVRQMIATDSPLPAGGALAARAMLRLGYVQPARRILQIHAPQLQHYVGAMSSLLHTAADFVRTIGAIPVAPGDKADAIESPTELAERAVILHAQMIDDQSMEILLDIAPGMHINANPAPEPFVATSIQMGNDVQEIIYPDGEEVSFDYADAPLRVYRKQARIRVVFKERIAETLRVQLNYQVCTETECLPPVSKSFQLRG